MALNKSLVAALAIMAILLAPGCKITENSDEETPPPPGGEPEDNQPIQTELIQPKDLAYLGAFRLP